MISVSIRSVLTFDTNNLTRTFDINILEDSVPELDEFIVLTIKDMGTQTARNAEGFSLGANHRITIPANDNTVGFASAMSTFVEGDGTETEVMVSVNRPAPVDITLNVSPASSSTAELGADYSISATSLMIPARESGGTITLTGMEDSRNEGNETIDLTLSVSGGFAGRLGTRHNNARGDPSGQRSRRGF